MAIDPIEVSTEKATKAIQIAGDALTALKGSAKNADNGTTIIEKVAPFAATLDVVDVGEPTTDVQLAGLIKVIKAISLGVANRIEGGTPGPGSDLTWTASCVGPEVVGDFVYISGANMVAKCDITNVNKLPVAGVIISKVGTTATMQSVGITEIFSTLTAGKVYFLGANGLPTATLPTGTPGQLLWRQPLGIALNTTALLLMPDTMLISYVST